MDSNLQSVCFPHPQIMTNDTNLSGNTTIATSPTDIFTGRAVGLALFLLLLVVVAVTLAYKYRTKIMTKLQFGKKRRQKNLEVDVAEVPQAVSHQYNSLGSEQSMGQQPIYENLAVRTSGCKEHSANTASQKR